jgi:hypothetical protein
VGQSLAEILHDAGDHKTESGQIVIDISGAGETILIPELPSCESRPDSDCGPIPESCHRNGQSNLPNEADHDSQSAHRHSSGLNRRSRRHAAHGERRDGRTKQQQSPHRDFSNLGGPHHDLHRRFVVNPESSEPNPASSVSRSDSTADNRCDYCCSGSCNESSDSVQPLSHSSGQPNEPTDQVTTPMNIESHGRAVSSETEQIAKDVTRSGKPLLKRRIVRRHRVSRSAILEDVPEKPMDESMFIETPAHTVAFTTLYLTQEEISKRFLETPQQIASADLPLKPTERKSLRASIVQRDHDASAAPDLVPISGMAVIALIGRELTGKDPCKPAVTSRRAIVRDTPGPAPPSVRFL